MANSMNVSGPSMRPAEHLGRMAEATQGRADGAGEAGKVPRERVDALVAGHRHVTHQMHGLALGHQLVHDLKAALAQGDTGKLGELLKDQIATLRARAAAPQEPAPAAPTVETVIAAATLALEPAGITAAPVASTTEAAVPPAIDVAPAPAPAAPDSSSNSSDM